MLTYFFNFLVDGAHFRQRANVIGDCYKCCIRQILFGHTASTFLGIHLTETDEKKKRGLNFRKIQKQSLTWPPLNRPVN